MNVISGSDKQIYNLGTFTRQTHGYTFQVQVNPALGSLLFFKIDYYNNIGRDWLLNIPEAGKTYFIGQIQSIGDQGYIILPTFSDVLTFNVFKAQNPSAPADCDFTIKVYQARDPKQLDSFSQIHSQTFPPGPPSNVQMGVWNCDPNIAYDRIMIRERNGQAFNFNGFSYYVYKGYHSDQNWYVNNVINFSGVVPAWGTLEIQIDQGIYKINGTSFGIGTDYPIWCQAYWNAGGAYPNWITTRKVHLIR
jgi:hypothetical protein